MAAAVQPKKKKSFIGRLVEGIYSQKDTDPVLVYDGLYIGSIGAAYNRNGLITAGITHVVCAAGNVDTKYVLAVGKII